MLYGVFSDIHSNLEALTAVLEFFEKNNVEGYICCGDLVGYGPDPEPVLETIKGLKNLSAIRGNHDLAVLGLMDTQWFNTYARAAVLWTRGVISFECKAFLESLDVRLDAPDFTLAHGSPRRPAEEYLLTAAQFKENMSGVHVWPLFVGHSHMPLCLRADTGGEAAPVKSLRAEDAGVEYLELEDGQEASVPKMPYGLAPTLFNPGSVGQPRDRDPRASCALYDSEKKTFKIARLPYDIAAVQNKIRYAGLPEFLAVRLAYGQ